MRAGPGRGAVVGTLVVAAALGAVLVALPWVSGGVTDPALGPTRVSLSGREAAPAVLGLCLAAGAAGLAAALTGRIARVVAAVVAAACGLGVAWAAAAVALDPGGALTSGASGRVGRADAGAVADAAATPWAFLAVLVGVVLALGGLALLRYARRWSGLSSRYDRPDARDRAPRTPRDAAVSDWDRLSRGDDPTR